MANVSPYQLMATRAPYDPSTGMLPPGVLEAMLNPDVQGSSINDPAPTTATVATAPDKTVVSPLQVDGPQDATERILMQMLNNPATKRYQKMYEDQLPLQMEDIEKQRSLSEAYRKHLPPAQLDASPLMALADSLTGSQLLKGYKRPESMEDTAVKLGAIQKLPAEERQKFMDNLQKLAAGQDSKAALALLMQKNKGDDTQGRFDKKALFQAEKEITSDITKHISDPLEKFSGFYNKAMAALDSGDYGRISQTLSGIARTVGEEKGALSEGDVGRQLLPTLEADIARLQAYVSGKSGKVDPAVVQSMKDNINQSLMALSETSQNLLDNRVRNWAPTKLYGPLFQEGGSGLSIYNNAANRIKMIRGTKGQPPVSGTTTQQPTGSGMDPGFEAFLKGRRN